MRCCGLEISAYNFPRFSVVDAESEEMKAAAAVNKVEH
jgi:hypothetical protein